MLGMGHAMLAQARLMRLLCYLHSDSLVLNYYIVKIIVCRTFCRLEMVFSALGSGMVRSKICPPVKCVSYLRQYAPGELGDVQAA
jgi:hypothetical protein